MKNYTKIILFGLLAFCAGCINFGMKPYNTFESGKMPPDYIPVWEPVQQTPPDLKPLQTKFIFDTSAILICFADFNVITKEADNYLKKESFGQISQMSGNLTAIKDEAVSIGGKIEHYFTLSYNQIIKFNNSNLPKSVMLKINSSSEMINPIKYDPGKYIRELASNLTMICKQRQIAGGFGIAGSVSREPFTNDEKSIFDKFGQDGLKIVDAIDGKTSIEGIIDKTNLSKEKIREIINYLIENNYLKTK